MLIPRLVVADVDGTLLNSRHELTGPTRDTLLALQRRGFYFTLATGKILAAVAGIVRELELTQPLIFANGALVQQPGGEILFETPVPPECLPELIEIAMEHSLDFTLFQPDRILTPRNTFNTLLVVEYADPLPVEVNLAEVIDQSFLKLLILERRDQPKLEWMEGYLNERFRGVLKARRSAPGMLEVFNAKTSKASALEKVAAYLGVSLDETLAIGDSYNDLDMFRAAGTAVAMGNAPLAVKEMADIVIGSNDEDGIAEFLTQLLS